MLDTYVASILGLPRTVPTSAAHGDLTQQSTVVQGLGYGHGVEGVTDAHHGLMIDLGRVSACRRREPSNIDYLVGPPCMVPQRSSWTLVPSIHRNCERWAGGRCPPRHRLPPRDTMHRCSDGREWKGLKAASSTPPLEKSRGSHPTTEY